MPKNIDYREVAQIASRYAPGEGSKTKSKKTPLRRKVKMAVMGKRYKTEAAKRSLKKRKQLEGYTSKRTGDVQRRIGSALTPAELRKLRGKSR